ncbi:MAG: hypothetical protein WD907_07035 [Bacilli bacterium]
MYLEGVYGITHLRVIEKYDEAGIVERYNYSGEIKFPVMGKHLKHISAWENERHDDPNTPDKYKVETEPHHHHHVPGDRSKRHENRDTYALKSVLKVVEPYIINNKSYP